MLLNRGWKFENHCIRGFREVAGAAAAIIPVLCLVTLLVAACGEPRWKPANLRMATRWTDDVTPLNARPEYPRPIMRRSEWLNLNGLWDYAITRRSGEPLGYHGKILVPFPIESALSGVADTVGPNRRLWYTRDFLVPESWLDSRVLLHFEASDWETEVWVDGSNVGLHRGGYDPFSFDITEHLSDSLTHELVVAVWDPTDEGTQPRGKQVRHPRGIFYTSVTGLWGTVWLEPVPETAIADYVAAADIDGASVIVSVVAPDMAAGDRLEVSVLANGGIVSDNEGPANRPLEVPVPEPRLWHPDDPYLYDLRIRLLRDGAELDEVDGYFGMREVSIGPDDDGVLRILLNGRFVFQSGPLDQGYWPDGLYTAPTEAAMVYDLEMTKAMGFNMLRKHVKVEPRTFYTWCDRLGILVWQDMPNANVPLEARDSDRPTDPQATAQFESELVRLVQTHMNHPSIVMWVPFNEGWGQHDSERVVDLIRAVDPSRLVNHASGWYDRGTGDVIDHHHYPDPRPPTPSATRAAVQGEFGGLGFNVSGHMWTKEGWGYALFPDRESLAQRFEDLFQVIRQAASDSGLSAAVYTQTTDIETENNGLMTYDREVAKLAPETVALAQRGFFAPRVERRAPIFIDRTEVVLNASKPGARIHYSTDGSEPTVESATYAKPIVINETTTVRARAVWPDGTASRVSSYTYESVTPAQAQPSQDLLVGLSVEYYETEDEWERLPDLSELTPVSVSTSDAIDWRGGRRDEYFALRYHGHIVVPETGVYGFHLTSDDGSKLLINGLEVVDNDGIHGAVERSGYVALEAGAHAIELLFFQRAGGVALGLDVDGPGIERQVVPAAWLRG
jgi:hypothetical protein